ncbi:hypothetical protein WJX73_003694 [Symbiochloris irregularis]|uniref:Cationic amino acid transporter C-terminal domain-containing protein n=1 Tax=Symbiochloris irregularis TaxID=706552 RepID=A0AAW1PU64_9CHLO
MQRLYDRFRQRALFPRSHQSSAAVAGGGPALRQCLGSWDLLFLAVGSAVGAGIFVVTGVAARDLAGPAVTISYLLAGFTALLSGLSYLEFAVDLPVAGGAFTYVSLVFGELPGWIVACNILLEYTLSTSAVARGLSGYLAALFGSRDDILLLPLGPLKLDFLAAGLVALLTILLCYGTAESAFANNVITSTNIIVIVYVICAGAPYGSVDNLVPFAPQGARGIFAAASVVFFSFVGFDGAVTAVEEAKDPRDLPWSIMAAVVICTVLYVSMALAICLMQPTALIDTSSPFAAAFLACIPAGAGTSGFDWIFLTTSARFIAFGAVTGIITTALATILGQARVFAVLGREHLLPAWLAQVHPKRLTPVNATLVTGICSGLPALLVDLESLAELVSIGTLFVFFTLSAAVLWRRHCEASGPSMNLIFSMLGLCVYSIGASLSYTLGAHIAVPLLFLAAWLLATVSMCFLPTICKGVQFSVPWCPFIPSLAMLANVHLIVSLGWPAYVRFGVWLVISLLVYILYSMNNAEAMEDNKPSRIGKSSSLQEVEMGDTQRATDSEVEELSMRMEEQQLLREGLQDSSAEP